MDQALNQKIDAYIAENKEQLLQDIAALVAIDSVEGTPEEGAPFGAGPRAALDKTLELAAGMGFATRNCENYIDGTSLFNPLLDTEQIILRNRYDSRSASMRSSPSQLTRSRFHAANMCITNGSVTVLSSF